MIETYAYGRAGLLGNPSDGYFGKTIALSVRNFRARVLLYPSARLEIKPAKADMPIFESLEDLHAVTRWRGYYGGIRIIQALLVRFIDYCREEAIELDDRNFTIEYETNIPLRLGMGGSSAIITASLRALCEYFQVEISREIQSKLVLEAETEELRVPAGPQDRVIQVFEGLVYMDFQRELMESRGYGVYEKLDPALLQNVYVAYRKSLSEGTEVFHNNIRGRWSVGDAEIVNAMKEWASYAEEGKQALLDGNLKKLASLINANFDLRNKLYRISDGNRQMVRTARSVGVSANFAGSGGAIVGTFEDEEMYSRLEYELSQIGVGVLKPKIE